MPVGGDVIQLTHDMETTIEKILNVYYFEAVTGAATLTELATWFNTNVVPDVKAVQHEGVTHINLELKNLFDLGETHDLALSGTGALNSADNLPSFIAGSVRLLHNSAGIRSGWKRYGPPDEAQTTANSFIAGYITLLENIATHLVNPLTPALATWSHVVVERVKFTDPIDGKEKYRLPINQGEYNAGYPTGFDVSTLVTSQVSRKVTT